MTEMSKAEVARFLMQGTFTGKLATVKKDGSPQKRELEPRVSEIAQWPMCLESRHAKSSYPVNTVHPVPQIST